MISDNIKKLRKKKGLSQDNLARVVRKQWKDLVTTISKKYGNTEGSYPNIFDADTKHRPFKKSF